MGLLLALAKMAADPKKRKREARREEEKVREGGREKKEQAINCCNLENVNVCHYCTKCIYIKESF